MSEINLPQHVAIIMDGNGRWAQSRSLSRTQGHIEGVRRVEEIVDEAARLGIKALTLFTFSTENWRRPDTEVSFLMNILSQVLSRKLKKLKDDNMRFQMIGRRDKIPDSLWGALEAAVKETQHNTGLVVNLAFNYGSRLEIIDAVREIAALVQLGELTPERIDEELISRHLYTRSLPDPDLLVRTSGEKRISNFLLWQLSYAEFYFTEVLWPDFTVEEFHKAIADYQTRDRRFGAVKSNGS